MVTSRKNPETSVFSIRIIDGEPESKDALRLGVEECGILMPVDNLVQSRRFGKVETLDEQRMLIAQATN